jgi:hypothetical protein
MKVQYSPSFASILTDNDDEARTIFFALKAYRDQLVNSMVKTAQTQFDADDYYTVAQLNEERPDDETITHILGLNDNVALGWEQTCNEFEELAFLHNELYKVNKALHALAEDNNLGGSNTNERFGWI